MNFFLHALRNLLSGVIILLAILAPIALIWAVGYSLGIAWAVITAVLILSWAIGTLLNE